MKGSNLLILGAALAGAFYLLQKSGGAQGGGGGILDDLAGALGGVKSKVTTSAANTGGIQSIAEQQKSGAPIINLPAAGYAGSFPAYGNINTPSGTVYGTIPATPAAPQGGYFDLSNLIPVYNLPGSGA